MPYIGNVSAFDSVDTEQIKDGAVTPDKVSSGIATTVGFESTGIDDNATAVKLTVADTGIDVTGTVTADGLSIDGAGKLGFNTTGSYTLNSVDAPDFGLGYKVSTDPIALSGYYGIALATARTERMRIDSSGNVGIGTSSPSDKLTIDSGQVRLSDNYGLRWGDNSVGIYGNASSGSDWMKLITAGSERMRIDSSGSVLIGKTTKYGSKFEVKGDSGSTEVASMQAGGTIGQFRFLNSAGSTIGYIQWSGSSTSYNTGSDYRLKTDVKPMTGATATFKQLKPVNFEWIASGERVDGFLAHELGEVIPAAATGSKDAMMDEEYEVSQAVEATYDDEGEELTASEEAVMATRSVPDMQGIDQSKVVPLLVATVQELIARIEALEGN